MTIKALSPEVFLKWNSLLQKTYTFTPDKGLPPPILSRIFAMYHLAMHDALNSVDQRNETSASTAFDSTADPNVTMNQADYEVFGVIGFQEGPLKVSVDSLYQAILGSAEEGPSKNNGIALGKAVASAILNAREGDAPYLAPLYPTRESGTTPGKYRYLPFNNFGMAYPLAGLFSTKT